MKARHAVGMGGAAAHAIFSLMALAAMAACTTAGAQSAGCYGVPAVPVPPSSGYIDIRAKGAIPDDDVDDTDIIQQAIYEAKDGQFIRFPAGRYIIRTNIQVNRPGITLWSDGATLHGLDPDNRSVMLKADRTRIYGFTFTGISDYRRTRPESNPISAWGEENRAVGEDGKEKRYITGVVIQNNKIMPATNAVGSSLSHGSSGAGIFVHRVRDFIVAGNEVRRTLADGIHITGGSRNGRVVRNKVYQTGDDMIAVVSYFPQVWRDKQLADPTWLDRELEGTRVRNIWVAENTVSDQYWGRGMAVVGGDNITFARNQISRATSASGILIAREHAAGGQGSSTSGVNNVLIDGNTITDVRTTPPGYLPDFEADKVNKGRAIDFGGIEMHATTNAGDFPADASSADWALAMKALGIQRVTYRNNVVQRTAKEILRTGADSPKGAIVSVTWANNQVYGWGKVEPKPPYTMLDGLAPTCVRSAWLANQPLPPTCSAGPAVPVATGATLDCSRFPAP